MGDGAGEAVELRYDQRVAVAAELDSALEGRTLAYGGDLLLVHAFTSEGRQRPNLSLQAGFLFQGRGAGVSDEHRRRSTGVFDLVAGRVPKSKPYVRGTVRRLSWNVPHGQGLMELPLSPILE